MPLLLTPFRNAVERLAEAQAAHLAEPENTLYRDALIQRFEFTYELSHTLLRRHLASITANPERIRQMPFSALIRTGNEYGLLRGDWTAWKRFREMRNQTSHAYDARLAAQVLAGIPDFLLEASHLLESLAQQQP